MLGLTASPAGKGTLAQTQAMLERLLMNMGGIHVQAVEECPGELEHHRSAAQIHIRELVRHPQEEDSGPGAGHQHGSLLQADPG